jgi:putative (di)nucleoside polyphosphate hydrolase
VKATSCGVLLLCARQEILLCHATGTAHWDIPKGVADPGEPAIDAAQREMREECGLVLAARDLRDLGRFAYRPAKDLHLFAALVERIDARLCACTSTFVDRFGRVVTEADDFRWVPFADIGRHCAKTMALVLTRKLALRTLGAELAAAGGPIMPGVAQAA